MAMPIFHSNGRSCSLNGQGDTEASSFGCGAWIDIGTSRYERCGVRGSPEGQDSDLVHPVHAASRRGDAGEARQRKIGQRARRSESFFANGMVDDQIWTSVISIFTLLAVSKRIQKISMTVSFDTGGCGRPWACLWYSWLVISPKTD